MEVILKQDVKNLGEKDDIVNVKPGYGRNYLIPQGLALTATGSNKKVVAENVKQAAHKAEKLKKDAEAIAEKIGNVVLEIKAKAALKTEATTAGLTESALNALMSASV